MDKIKILAAVLALAGCMENGMGMEENIEINNGNVILRSADTSEWNDKIEAAGFPELKSIELRSIDFNDCSDLSGLNAVISMFDDVVFTDCKNFSYKIPGIYHAKNIRFIEYDDNLSNICEIVRLSCNFEYLQTCAFVNSSSEFTIKDSYYEDMLEIFKYTQFTVLNN